MGYYFRKPFKVLSKEEYYNRINLIHFDIMVIVMTSNLDLQPHDLTNYTYYYKYFMKFIKILFNYLTKDMMSIKLGKKFTVMGIS